MSVRMSLLAMLAHQPSYGYLLRAEFDRRTGATWPLNIGQVYKGLELLERDHLVTRSTQTDADGHVFYEVTDAGRTAVKDWLNSADPVTTPNRNDLAVKIAIASTLPGVTVEDAIRAQRQAALTTLQRLTRQHSVPPAPAAGDVAAAEAGAELGHQLIADSILFEAETEVRWLDHVEQRIRNARADGATLAIPFDTNPPRRGRPARRSPEAPSAVASLSARKENTP